MLVLTVLRYLSNLALQQNKNLVATLQFCASIVKLDLNLFCVALSTEMSEEHWSIVVTECNVTQISKHLVLLDPHTEDKK